MLFTNSVTAFQTSTKMTVAVSIKITTWQHTTMNPKQGWVLKPRGRLSTKLEQTTLLLLQMVKPVCQGCTALTTGNEIFLYVGGKFPFLPSPLCPMASLSCSTILSISTVKFTTGNGLSAKILWLDSKYLIYYTWDKKRCLEYSPWNLIPVGKKRK